MKKNDTAYMLSNWNNRGTVLLRKVTIQSAGKKRATILDAESGEMLGRHFVPAYNVICGGHNAICALDVGQTAEELHASAVYYGEQLMGNLRAELNRKIANGGSEGYIAAMKAELDGIAPTITVKLG